MEQPTVHSGLPFAQSAENNREPILAELPRLLEDRNSVLEIGAGTGQHAVAFAGALTHVQWQPTEHPDTLVTLRPRVEAAALANLASPAALDIAEGPWPSVWPDAVYTANTLHIVSRELVEQLFHALGEHATPGSRLLVYGPFNYNGSFTTPSNEQFDAWLRERNPVSGIRDFEWVDGLAQAAGYALVEDVTMPANNRLLCWEMGASAPFKRQ
jgi:SAM-dependent methyltransferase